MELRVIFYELRSSYAVRTSNTSNTSICWDENQVIIST